MLPSILLLGSSFFKTFDKYTRTNLQLMQAIVAPTINRMMCNVIYSLH